MGLCEWESSGDEVGSAVACGKCFDRCRSGTSMVAEFGAPVRGPCFRDSTLRRAGIGFALCRILEVRAQS